MNDVVVCKLNHVNNKHKKALKKKKTRKNIITVTLYQSVASQSIKTEAHPKLKRCFSLYASKY